jgi:uroporphyrinogen decarboxylase
VTPKQRVIAALNHRQPDRVPMGEFAFDHKIIEHYTGKPSYWRPFSNAKAQIALWEGKRDMVVESWKEAIVFLAERLEHDILAVQLAPSRHKPIEAPRQIAPDTWVAADGNVLKFSPQTEAIRPVHDGPANLPNYSEADFPLTDFQEPDESEWELVRFAVQRYGRTHFIAARSGDGTLALPGGMENALVLMAEKPGVIAAAIAQASHEALQMDRLWAREGVDGLAPGADYAMNAGLLFSPKLFERLCYPAICRQTALARQLGLYTLKHACGNNWAIMDYLVDGGYDAYQSIQASATMDICKLKDRYGDRITLWGGVQVETLVRGTPADVRQEVIRAIRHCAPGGGFILGASHSIVNATKPANYDAFLEAWREYR